MELSKEQKDYIKYWLEKKAYEHNEDGYSWYVGAETYTKFQKLLFENWRNSLPIEKVSVNEGIWHQIRNQKANKTSISKKDIEKIFKKQK